MFHVWFQMFVLLVYMACFMSPSVLMTLEGGEKPCLLEQVAFPEAQVGSRFKATQAMSS